MDEQTARFYASRAHETAIRYEGVADRTPALRWLAWKTRTRVLDVGCGSGRDLTLLAGLGCDVWGVEPSTELRDEALALHPELADRIADGCLPDLGQPFGGGFDSVLCSAVLMHLPVDALPPAIASLSGLLVRPGRLQVSFVNVASGLDEAHRYSDGRLFTPIGVGTLVDLAASAGLRLDSEAPYDDPWGRSEARWTTARFVAI
jgi:SAM-dependent methyltransferase